MVPFFWTGDMYPGYPYLHTSLSVCNGFLRYTSDMTPEFLTTNTGAMSFWSLCLYTYNHVWNSNSGSSVQHSVCTDPLLFSCKCRNFFRLILQENYLGWAASSICGQIYRLQHGPAYHGMWHTYISTMICQTPKYYFFIYKQWIKRHLVHAYWFKRCSPILHYWIHHTSADF